MSKAVNQEPVITIEADWLTEDQKDRLEAMANKYEIYFGRSITPDEIFRDMILCNFDDWFAKMANRFETVLASAAYTFGSYAVLNYIAPSEKEEHHDGDSKAQ